MIITIIQLIICITIALILGTVIGLLIIKLKLGRMDKNIPNDIDERIKREKEEVKKVKQHREELAKERNCYR